MRMAGWSVKAWSPVAGWGLLAVATVYLTFPIANLSAPDVSGRPVIAGPTPVTSFDGLRFNGRTDALPE